MGMPHPTERWTADLVRALPDDGNRYELIGGELLVTPSPARLHQTALAALVRRLDPYVRSNAIGELLWSPADLSLGEDEVLQPDLFVFRRAFEDQGRDWESVTDLLLVIEVLSPSTARYDRVVKRQRYQRARVPEFWIVDLDARLIERWRPDDTRPEIAADDIAWRPSPELPPFIIGLPTLFSEILGS